MTGWVEKGRRCLKVCVAGLGGRGDGIHGWVQLSGWSKRRLRVEDKKGGSARHNSRIESSANGLGWTSDRNKHCGSVDGMAAVRCSYL